jgi:YggT family protein
MLNEALLFLLSVLLQPFAVLLLLRFYMQWLRISLRNPFGEFVLVLTDFIVLRARRVIPSAGKADTASLVLALAAETLYLAAVLWVQDVHPSSSAFIALPLWAAVKLLKVSVYLLMAAVFIQAILSWIGPYSPLAGPLAGLTRPFLQPLRRHIPLAGNIDLTPLVLLIICQLIIILPLGWLESVVTGMLWHG